MAVGLCTQVLKFGSSRVVMRFSVLSFRVSARGRTMLAGVGKTLAQLKEWSLGGWLQGGFRPP